VAPDGELGGASGGVGIAAGNGLSADQVAASQSLGSAESDEDVIDHVQTDFQHNEEGRVAGLRAFLSKKLGKTASIENAFSEITENIKKAIMAGFAKGKAMPALTPPSLTKPSGTLTSNVISAVDVPGMRFITLFCDNQKVRLHQREYSNARTCILCHALAYMINNGNWLDAVLL
jgi:hypothetical protein